MSFTLPDLVIEGAIRKGFDFLRNNAGTDAGTFFPAGNVVDIPARVGIPAMSMPPVDAVPGNRAEVLPGFPVANAAGTGFNATLRIPNVATLLSTSSTGVEYIDTTDNRAFRINVGATISSTAVSNSGTMTTITGTLSSVDGESTLDNGTLLLPLTVLETLPPSGNSQVSNYIFLLQPNLAGVSWTMSGERAGDEVFGAGGEILNMLFDFRTGSKIIDGGLDQVISRKYSMEPIRLREFFRKNQIAIVQSFSDVQAHLPCISIQLANDGEDQGLALTDDFGGIESFDSNNGIGRDENTIHANTTINVGIHTKEQLLTKYLYHIAKYFVLSAKEDLIRQNFIIATFKGSDFTRDASWQGDHVYTRFLNISGKTEDSWVNLDEIVVALEDVGINIFVPTVGVPASTGPGSNQTPAQDVGGNNFVNASRVFSSVTAAAAVLQLPTSLYHTGDGMAVFIQRDGTGAQLFRSKPFDITANDKLTGMLTASGIDFNIDSEDNPVTYQVLMSTMMNPLTREQERYLEVHEPATGLTSPVSFVSTVQTPPSGGLVSSQPRQNINDADGVIHRSDVNESDLI